MRLVWVLVALACGCATPAPTRTYVLEGRLEPDPIFGGQIFVHARGPESAPLVVMIHGLGGSADDFAPLLPSLEQDFHVLAVDLPGFARSPHVSGNAYSPARYVEALERLLRGRRFHLVGHSMGASIAMLYAARHRRQVDRLVVIDAAGVLHGSVVASGIVVRQDERRGVLKTITQWLSSRVGFDPAATLRSPTQRKLLLQDDPNKIAALSLAVENFGPVIDRVRQPTLIVWGERDEIAPLRTGRLLASRLHHATLEVIPGVGHVPMDGAAARTGALIRAFLTQPSPAERQKITLEPGTERLVVRARTNEVLEGRYDQIEIRRSSVTLRNVVARSIKVHKSDVIIENARVIGDGVALSTVESRVELTSAELRGAIGIEADASRIDAAGITVVASEAAFRVKKRGASFVISVSKVKSPRFDQYIHQSRKVEPGSSF